MRRGLTTDAHGPAEASRHFLPPKTPAEDSGTAIHSQPPDCETPPPALAGRRSTRRSPHHTSPCRGPVERRQQMQQRELLPAPLSPTMATISPALNRTRFEPAKQHDLPPPTFRGRRVDLRLVRPPAGHYPLPRLAGKQRFQTRTCVIRPGQPALTRRPRPFPPSSGTSRPAAAVAPLADASGPCLSARNEIASRFHALTLAIATVRSTTSFSHEVLPAPPCRPRPMHGQPGYPSPPPSTPAPPAPAACRRQTPATRATSAMRPSGSCRFASSWVCIPMQYSHPFISDARKRTSSSSEALESARLRLRSAPPIASPPWHPAPAPHTSTSASFRLLRDGLNDPPDVSFKRFHRVVNVHCGVASCGSLLRSGSLREGTCCIQASSMRIEAVDDTLSQQFVDAVDQIVSVAHGFPSERRYRSLECSG